MLRKKDKETKVPGITKSILERGGCLRPLSIAWKRSFPRIVFQKELQTVLYYLHIGVFVFSFFRAYFAVSVARLMQSSLQIRVS
jgi:hypothetical protein